MLPPAELLGVEDEEDGGAKLGACEVGVALLQKIFPKLFGLGPRRQAGWLPAFIIGWPGSRPSDRLG